MPPYLVAQFSAPIGVMSLGRSAYGLRSERASGLGQPSADQRTCKMTKTVAREKVDRIARERAEAQLARSAKREVVNHPTALDEFGREGMGVAAKE